MRLILLNALGKLPVFLKPKYSFHEELLFSSLLFSSLLMLLLGSCTEEILTPISVETSTSKKTETVAVLPADKKLTDAFHEAQPIMYQECGKAFRDRYFGLTADTEPYFDPAFTVMEAEPFDINIGLSKLEALKYLNVLDPLDIEKASKFLRYISASPLGAATKLSDARELVNEFIVSEGITVERTPLTYHTAEILKASVFSLDAPGFLGGDQKGADDGLLCVFNAKTCKGPRALIIDVAFAALGVAAAPATAGASILVAALIKEYWKAIFKAAFKDFCGEGAALRACDDCSFAYGLGYYFDDCITYGIRALGKFEYAERFTFNIDGNEDGTFVSLLQQLPGSAQFPQGKVPASVIFNLDPATSSGFFDATVDVTCDGGTIYPWRTPENPYRMILSPPPSYPVPSASIRITNSPPPHPQAPLSGFYRFGTPLTFSLANVSSPAFYTFAGWSTTSGGSPSSANSGSSFTTTFFGTQSNTASVNANFRNTCDNTIYSVAYPLVILP